MFTVAVSAYTVTDSNGCCQTSFCVIMFSSPRNNTLLCPNIDQLFELSAFQSQNRDVYTVYMSLIRITCMMINFKFNFLNIIERDVYCSWSLQMFIS